MREVYCCRGGLIKGHQTGCVRGSIQGFQWASCVSSWRVNPSGNAAVCSELNGGVNMEHGEPARSVTFVCTGCGVGGRVLCDWQELICCDDMLPSGVFGDQGDHQGRYPEGCVWPMLLYQSGFLGRASQGGIMARWD